MVDPRPEDDPWRIVQEAGIEERGNGYFILKRSPNHPNQYPMKVWKAIDELCNEWDCEYEYED